jgi:Flp pilus assembly protein protease CpaA
MNALLSLTASFALVALALWMFSGPLLRVGGVLLAVCGLWLTASTGTPVMAVASVLGGVAWLAGHWLFAVRHHYFRSPLARRIFVQALPAQFDPTRGWGVPNVPRDGRR